MRSWRKRAGKCLPPLGLGSAILQVCGVRVCWPGSLGEREGCKSCLWMSKVCGFVSECTEQRSRSWPSGGGDAGVKLQGNRKMFLVGRRWLRARCPDIGQVGWQENSVPASRAELQSRSCSEPVSLAGEEMPTFSMPTCSLGERWNERLCLALSSLHLAQAHRGACVCV